MIHIKIERGTTDIPIFEGQDDYYMYFIMRDNTPEPLARGFPFASKQAALDHALATLDSFFEDIDTQLIELEDSGQMWKIGYADE